MVREVRRFISEVALVLIFGTGASNASASQRQIEVDGQHRSDAVIVANVTVNNVDIQCGLVASSSALQPIVPFEAGDDWLQNTTLYLVNRTNKVIVFGQISLWFPETGSGTALQPMRVYNVTFGRLPAAAAVSGRTGRPLAQLGAAQPLTFAPGQTMSIHLADYISGIQASVDNMLFPSVTRVIIRRESFVFSDGMRWAGEYTIPDAQHPGKWVHMPSNYFPGDMHVNWPPTVVPVSQQ